MSTLQLVDLPPAWLDSMVLAQAPPEDQHLVDMFRTCSKLQQLVLRQPVVRSWISVYPDGIEKLGCPLFARALAMAEASEAKLHLDLGSTCANRAALGLLFTSVAPLIRPAQQAQQPPSFQLKCITAVSIDGDKTRLDSILHDVLVQHCPNLQELKLQGIMLATSYKKPLLTCTSLQTLIIDGVPCLDSTRFQRHLLNLPSLAHLELHGVGDYSDYEEDGMFFEAVSRYSSQLRCLQMTDLGDEVELFLPWSLSTQLPLLQELNLDVDLVGDKEMQQLLTSAPNLKRLELRSISGLKSSFAQASCSWQQLRLSDVYVPELAQLPLSSCTRLECGWSLHMHCRFDSGSTAEQVTAAVSAVQAAGGLHFTFAERVQIHLALTDQERLAAAAPLLQQINDRTDVIVEEPRSYEQADPWSDCRALLLELGQHLTCDVLQLSWDHWAGSPGALAQVPELLPHVTVFQLWYTPEYETELVHMVRTASRPFTLSLRPASDEALSVEAQLQQAMQEAGHQLVTIKQSDDDD